MQKILTQIWHGTLYAGAIIFLTWLFFGPVAGFHHMIRCGVLCPVFLDGETPEGGLPMWGEFEVRFSLIRFVISAGLWATCVFFVVRFLGSHTGAATIPAAPSASPPLRFRIGVISGLILVKSGLVFSIVPFFAYAGIAFPILISAVALVGGFCSVTSIFSERGFNRVIAALCAALACYALLEYGRYFLMIIP